MKGIRQYFRDLREGARQLCSREFWREVEAEAVRRIDALTKRIEGGRR